MGDYSKIPPMPQCTSCGGCCGPATMRRDEAKRVRRYTEDNGVGWEVDDANPAACGFLRKTEVEGKYACAIYEVRPWVCRAFGVFREMECTFFPEAHEGRSYTAQQAVVDKNLTPNDRFIGEYFEEGYLARLIHWMTDGMPSGTISGRHVLPLGTARDLMMRGLISNLHHRYGGKLDDLISRLGPEDRQTVERLMNAG